MLASVLLRTCLLLAATLVVGTVGAQRNVASSSPPSSSQNSANTNAQHTEPGLVIHQSVRRVIVDVVVSDSNGKPVSGLTADDFSIAEDGKAQRVRSFDVHDFDLISDSLPKRPLRCRQILL